jgi:hypothetical protein
VRARADPRVGPRRVPPLGATRGSPQGCSTHGVRAATGTMRAMDPRPLPDPAKLLADWMEWETGETTPGRVMSNLKTGGLRDLLEELASKVPPAG